MTGETPEVRSDKKREREKSEEREKREECEERVVPKMTPRYNKKNHRKNQWAE